MTSELDELRRLRAENARLRALLDVHGIVDLPRNSAPVDPKSTGHRTPTEKVALFRRLFRGRTDVYPVRWENKSGKSGYAPACANEWRPGICEKPRIKCADCVHQSFIELSDQVIYAHLSGRHTVGIYPLLPEDTCFFVAVDFDEADWREDGLAFMASCRTLEIPASLEISRSGNGAHVWIFFESAVPARDARRLATAIISHVCARTRQLQLTSYDRIFPNQDTLPKGGYGNLIALPLQRGPREAGWSVFVDENLCPYPDQWSYLASVNRMPAQQLEDATMRASGGGHPLDVTFVSPEEADEPWIRRSRESAKVSGAIPRTLDVTVANMIFFKKSQLPQALVNRLIRLAAFQNPEFYRAQAMRFAVWDKPRVIGCAENFPKHIALPRGCRDAIDELCELNAIRCNWTDERNVGAPLETEFVGSLREDQQLALDQLLKHEIGVLCAPTAFGKTVTAAALIARRATNTLILVHRSELLKQWSERLRTFLRLEDGEIGTIVGGKSRPTGKLDIAVMQSLSRKGEVSDLVADYGHVIVDECHHVSAYSFESILKRVQAKYVTGLTATPIRRDGQHPIIFMQCGPIRHRAAAAEGMPEDLSVVPKLVSSSLTMVPEAPIQDVFVQLTSDEARTALIADEISANYSLGRKILVLTERTDHIDVIRRGLPESVSKVFVLHGRMPKKERGATVAELSNLPPEAPRVLIATGKLLGEGFDHAALDTLILAMPISWRGTLQQYAGRLHRDHAGKADVRIVDFVDTCHPALGRMWRKRQQGYRAMGYRIDAG
jgi:superfamily II DNA or RNA helicase